MKTYTYHVYKYTGFLSYKYAIFREGDVYDRDYLNDLFYKNLSWIRFTTVTISSSLPIWNTKKEEEVLSDLLHVKKFWLAV